MSSLRESGASEDNGRSDLSAWLATRVRELRAARGDTLDALAARSGVSRSAISQIERSATSATAVVLDKLATALGVPLAALFDTPADPAPPGPLARRSEQPIWRDPESGYLRRSVSPAGWPSALRIVEVEFPAGASVAYETAERDVEIHQQVWVLSGRIEVTIGSGTHQLAAGDCLAMQLDRPTAFRNRSRRRARYCVAVVSEPLRARRAS